MEISVEDKKIKFENLKGKYDEKLLEDLKMKRFEVLESLPMVQREDEKFMGPLLCAIINEYNNYEFYKHLIPRFQLELAQNRAFAISMILNAPEEIVNTPEVVRYMPPDLLEDSEVVAKLYNTNNSQLLKEMNDKVPLKERVVANPDLLNNKDFMVQAISEDASMLKYINEEMAHDYDLFRQAATKNKEVVDYIIENSKTIGKEAVDGATEAVVDTLVEKRVEIFEMKEELGTEEKRIKRDFENMQYLEAHKKMLHITSNIAHSEIESVTEEEVRDMFNIAEMTVISLRKTLENNSEHLIAIEDVRQMLNIKGLRKALNKSPLKGDAEFEKNIKEYEAFVLGIEHISRENWRQLPETIRQIKIIETELKKNDLKPDIRAELEQKLVELRESITMEDQNRVAELLDMQEITVSKLIEGKTFGMVRRDDERIESQAKHHASGNLRVMFIEANADGRVCEASVLVISEFAFPEEVAEAITTHGIPTQEAEQVPEGNAVRRGAIALNQAVDKAVPSAPGM